AFYRELRTPCFSSRFRLSFSITPTTSERNSQQNFPTLTGFGKRPSAILRRTVFTLIPPSIRPVSSRLTSTSPFVSLISFAFPLWLARPSEQSPSDRRTDRDLFE